MNANVDGLCEPELLPVRQVVEGLVASGREPGGAVAVFRDRRPVLDLTFGEHRPGVPWSDRSLALSYSTGKPLVALAVLTLVADGLVGLDDPIARHWPEFGQAGKESITVRDVLCHRSGLWAFPASAADLDPLDEQTLFEALAAADPLHRPGEHVAEHALTYGHLLDPVVRAVTGRRLADRWAAVARAQGWDAWLAVGEDDLGRVSPSVVLRDGWDRLSPPGSPGEVSLTRPGGCTDLAVVGRDPFRRAGFPAISLHATARALADFYSDLTDPAGRVADLLGPELYREYLAVQAHGDDLVLAEPTRWTLGLQRDEEGIGHGGLGGSVARWDHRGWSFAYVSRGLGGHDRVDAVHDEVVRLLG